MEKAPYHSPIKAEGGAMEFGGGGRGRMRGVVAASH